MIHDVSTKRERCSEPSHHGDGFGVGWYDAAPVPGVFRSIEPAWNDQNLRELAGHVSSPVFFGHIRAAIGSAVQQTNCHPFRYGRWLFMHNGFIDGFAAIKRDLVLAVDESLFPEIKGQADTEVLFYLALTCSLEDDPPDAVARAIAVDADRLPSHPKLIEDAVRLRSGHPRHGVRLPAFVRGGSRAASTGCVAVWLSVRVRGLTLVPETNIRSAVWMRPIRIWPTARSMLLLP